MWYPNYAIEEHGFSHSPSLSLESSNSSEAWQPFRDHQQVYGQEVESSNSFEAWQPFRDHQQVYGQEGRKIYVGGLHCGIERTDLKKHFQKFGRIKKIWVAHKPPGFAFIDFSADHEAHYAIRKMNGAIINGSKIRVALSHKDGKRRGGGGPRYFGDRRLRRGRAPRGGHHRVVGGGGSGGGGSSRALRSRRGRRPYYGRVSHYRRYSRYGAGGGGGGGGGFHSRWPIGV